MVECVRPPGQGLGETVWLFFPQPASVAAEARPGPFLLNGLTVPANGERPEEDDDTDSPCDGLQHI